MAGFFAAAGFIGRAVATGGGGATDCHKGLRYVGVSGVKLQTAVADNVVGLEYQGVFNVGVVDKLPDGRKERFHVLIDQPQNPALRLQVMSAVYVALSRWEPRLTLDSITINSNFDGSMVVELTGRRNNGVPVSLSVSTGAENGSD